MIDHVEPQIDCHKYGAQDCEVFYFSLNSYSSDLVTNGKMFQ